MPKTEENRSILNKTFQARKVKIAFSFAFMVVLILSFVFSMVYLTNTYKVNNSSMEPTYTNGDKVFVIPGSTPQEGKVGVFKGWDSRQYIIKRVLVEPGKETTLPFKCYTSGLVEPGYDLNKGKDTKLTPIDSKSVESIVETKDGKCKVKINGYFVVGDNLGNSEDSFDYGVLPKENAVGRVAFG